MRHNMIRWQVPFMHRFRLSRIYFLLGIHNPRAFCIQTYTILIYSRFRILNYRNSINNNSILKRFYSNKVNTKVIQMHVLGRLKLNKFVNCNNLVFL